MVIPKAVRSPLKPLTQEGFYEFTDLANGDYVVVETQPVGFESVTDADGTDDNQIATTIDGANVDRE